MKITALRDNELRLALSCNSLEAFATGGTSHDGSTVEAAELARFLECELPSILSEQECSLRAALNGDGGQDHRYSVALSLLAEDRVRLLSLSSKVIELLKRYGGRRGKSDPRAVSEHAARYVAAQRHFMDAVERLTRAHTDS